MLSAGFLLMASFWALRPPFHFLLPGLEPIPGFPAVAAAGAGFLLVVAAFRLMGRGDAPEDFSPVAARAWLAVFLLLGAWLRLHRFQEFHPTWGWDPFWEIIETLNTIELGENALLFHVGSREPFFTYFLALLWRCVPGLSPYAVANVGSALIDLAAVWMLYLVGSELGSRRLGLVMAALAAVSKPMIIMSIACTRGVSTTLAAALVLLFSLRVLKEPRLGRFLAWGAVLGAAAYTYTGIRPLLLFTALSMLAAVAFSASVRNAGWPAALLALAGGGWLTAEFIKRNAFAGPSTPGVGFLFGGAFLGGALAAAVAAWFILSRREEDRSASALRGWAVGTALACLIVLPLVLHPLFANHVMNSSQAFRSSLSGGWAVLASGLDRTWTHLFTGGWLLDREDMNILRDTFLDILSIPALLLGLAALLARPDRRGIWLLLTAAAGFFPYAFSDDPHSVRLLGGLPAAFALAALAIDRLLAGIRSAVPGSWAGRGIAVLGLAVILATGAVVDSRIWGEFAKQADRNVEIDRLLQAEPQDFRVFFAPAGDFFLMHQFAVQRSGGRPAYLMKASNPIHLDPGEAVPGVVVYASLSGDFGNEEERLGRIRRAYPDLPCKRIDLRNEKALCRMEIPASRLKEGSGLFRIQRASSSGWRRIFPAWNFGLARGNLVSREDIASTPDAPLPPDVEGQQCRITGTISLAKGGKVSFLADTGDIVRLEVAGRRVLDHLPRPGGKTRTEGSVHLPPGIHPLVLRVHRRGDGIPGIHVILPGETEARPLSDIGI